MTSADLVLPEPGPGAPGAAPPSAAVVGADGPLEDAVARVSSALEAFGHLVVLVPSALPAQERRRLHTVRALLEAERIALVDCELPPLGVALLGRQLRQLCATDLGPGVLAGAARLLGYYLHCGAVLGSVAKLDRVDVALSSHVRSWVPGVQFAVLAHPQPAITQLTGSPRLPGPDYLTHLAVAEHGLRVDWVKGELARQWRPQHVHDVPLPASSAAWWGNGRLVEFTAYIPDPRVLYQLVTSVRRDACGWCGLETIGDRCLFCSARVEHGPPGGAGAAGPRNETGQSREIGPTRR